MRTRGKFAILATAAAALLLAQGTARAGDIAKCEDGVAKNSRNVGNQEQKKNRKCVKDAVSDNVDTCVDTESPKAIIKEGKIADLFLAGGKCDAVVAQVNTSSSDIATDTEDAAGDILRRTFGDPVDGIVVGSKCHDKIAKRAGKKFDTQLKAFRGCVKDSAPLTQAEADGCISTGVNDAKAQTTVQGKLLDDITAQCGATYPVPGTEDGDCAAEINAAGLAACVGNITDCNACLAMVNSHLGSVDCDIIDDTLNNNSCASPGPPPCPMAAGIYTNTQTAGGMLSVDGITPFPFPAGGTIVQHVYAASQPTCVHTSVVPSPGGFSAPLFCIPGLNFSVQVAQDGCGVGQIDSNGGSDFTITEVGDTSSPVICGLPASNCLTPPGDSNVQVNVDVGDSIADTCGSGTANAAVSVPVHTITWSHTPTISCTGTGGGGPGPDTTGPGGPGDSTVVEFDQTLDFTSDTTAADWSDLDPDGCCLAGAGPSSPQLCAFGGGGPSGLGSTGTCIDLTGVNLAGPDVTTVASGAIGSNGSPLYDLTFLTELPNEITGPSGAPTATCGSPPSINFAGAVTRCVP